MASYLPEPPRENLGKKLPPPQHAFDPMQEPVVTRSQALFPDNLLDTFSVHELLEARARIDARLPATSLKDIDLEKELVLQVLALQALQGSVISDQGASPAHRAQVANSLSQALANLVKVQQDVYQSERLKKIEKVLIESLQNLPADAAERFLQGYEQALQSKGL